MTSSRRRILLVEDHEDSRNVCRIILEHGGFEVAEARTGPEAVERARELLPDLILMDIAIPDIDGWQVVAILRAEESTRAIPVIALTAHALDSDRARAAEIGCDGFLAKPVLPTDVLREVRSRLHRLAAIEP